MRRLFLGLVVLLAGVCSARATTIHVEADDTSGFSYFGGQDVNFGVSVMVGTFQLADGTALSDSAILAHKTDLAYLKTNFTRFSTDEAHIGNGSANLGELSVELNGTTNNTTPSLTGKQIYYFVVSGTDNSTYASSLSTATQFGIYYMDKAINPTWAFPDDDDPLFSDITLDISDLTLNNAGQALASGAHVLVGTFGPDLSNYHAPARNFVLAVVPEPASGALLLLSGAALVGRRRRRA